MIQSVKSMIEVVKESNLTETIHFFAFCGKDPQEVNKKGAVFPTSNYLLKEICDILKEQGINIPSNLNIIPLPAQSAQNTAMIQARADKKFNTAGGSTSFENKVLKHQLGVDAGDLFIFQDSSIQFISSWEGSNAEHLMETIGARIVSRETFKAAILDDSSSKPSKIHLEHFLKNQMNPGQAEGIKTFIEELIDNYDKLPNEILEVLRETSSSNKPSKAHLEEILKDQMNPEQSEAESIKTFIKELVTNYDELPGEIQQVLKKLKKR